MAPESSTETAGTTFDPRKRRTSRRAVGGPPPRQLPTEGATVGEGSAAASADPVPMALVAVPVAEGSGEETADGGRLPGRQRRPGFREIHVTVSGKAYRLLGTARAEDPGASYGDLIASALVRTEPTLLAQRPPPPDDPLLRPLRTQRLHVEGRTRSPPFNAAPAQPDAIRALADEVGIPNLSELVDRPVVLTYDHAAAATTTG